MILGEGGFGKVFKGWLDERPSSRTGSGSVIAVKKLNAESLQGYDEWKVTRSAKNPIVIFLITIIS